MSGADQWPRLARVRNRMALRGRAWRRGRLRSEGHARRRQPALRGRGPWWRIAGREGARAKSDASAFILSIPAPLETENEGQLPRPVRAGRAPLDVRAGAAGRRGSTILPRANPPGREPPAGAWSGRRGACCAGSWKATPSRQRRAA